MTTGSISLARQATCPVSIMDETNGRFVTFNVVIDTGFNGDVQLPSRDIARLSLPQVGIIDTVLADGSVVESQAHGATVLWLGNRRTVRVVDGEEGIPLVGANLLWDSITTIEWQFGGRVSIEPISRPDPEDE